MGFRRKKNKIIIEGIKPKYTLKTYGKTPATDVCDMCLDALKIAMQETSKITGVPLDIYIKIAIREIEKLQERK